jgi:hypothetical protein
MFFNGDKDVSDTNVNVLYVHSIIPEFNSKISNISAGISQSPDVISDFHNNVSDNSDDSSDFSTGLLNLHKEVIYHILEYTHPNLGDIKSAYGSCHSLNYLKNVYYLIRGPAQKIKGNSFQKSNSNSYVPFYTYTTKKLPQGLRPEKLKFSQGNLNNHGPLYTVGYNPSGIFVGEYGYFKNNKKSEESYCYCGDELRGLIIINGKIRTIEDDARFQSLICDKIKETDLISYEFMCFAPSIDVLSNNKNMCIRETIPLPMTIEYK